MVTKRSAPVSSNKKPSITISTVAKDSKISSSSSKHMALDSSTVKTGQVRSEKHKPNAAFKALGILDSLFFVKKDAPEAEETREAKEDESLTSTNTRSSTDSTVDTSVWSKLNKQAWSTINDETSTATNALTLFINFMLSL